MTFTYPSHTVVGDLRVLVLTHFYGYIERERSGH